MSSTLIVEDGTQVASADSYVSSVEAATYLTTRGDTTFVAAKDTQKDQALRSATDYMLGAFRYRWSGYRVGTVQSLDWPRIYVPITDIIQGYGYGATFYAENVVPVQVRQACADLAVRALVGDLAPDIDPVIRSVKTGPVTVEYDPYGVPFTVYRAILAKLAPLFTGNGGSVQIVRT